ncbi:hypothetical protein GTR02_00125 [Kineococcus sp. R8]|uniref:hypothetical protein n=1 Tax=Kineococcus siccus TaxID=2696567 RepID=UPI001412A48E|nr:hypothetical protein [Kineococcus siccus]NAZ80228.1 hypothetical protein [Kineococcus siccus]
MDQRTWPEQDRKWVARYQSAITGKHVPADVLERREGELLAAVRAAGLPAAEVFGDAAELAGEDATELGTTGEAVRTSEGGGRRAALREVGGTLLALGAVAVASTALRNGWFVDLELGATLVAVSVAAVFLGWVVGRSLFSAGRPAWMAGVLLGVLAVAVAGIAAAVEVGPDVVVAGDVPVLLLGAGLLVPGVVVLVVAARMPQPSLRLEWDDAEWLRRFRGGLVSRLVPRATARAHVAEVEQQVSSSGVPAHAEFGHPLVLAREVARADRTARARWWWVATVAGTGVPLVIGLLILVNNSWGALSIPLGAFLVLVGLSRSVAAWRGRPWARQA